MNTNGKKISIIGSGFVGSSIAYALMLKKIADEIVLIDINKELSGAEALDIKHGMSEFGCAKIKSGEYSDIKDSDLIIITAGRNRQPNETRLNLSQDNIKIAKSIADEIKKYYTKGVVLIVSNPVDIITHKMTQWLTQWLNLPKGRVFGTGCLLDTSRFISNIADYTNTNIKDVDAMVIGEHGESQVHLWSRVKVKDLSLKEYCKSINLEFGEKQKEEIEQKTIKLGTEIIKGKGKTHFGIATCVCYIADAILNNKKITTTLTSTLQGEYGIDNIAVSLPSIVSSNGIEKVLTDELTEYEYSKLLKSVSSLQEFLQD